MMTRADASPVTVRERSAAQNSTPAVATAIIVAAALEIGLLALAALGVLTPIGVALGHGLICSAMLIWFWHHRASAGLGVTTYIAILATLAAGPFGAVGALLLPWLTRRSVDNTELLKSWYERIALSAATDPLTHQSDQISIGRSADLHAPMPAAFADLFATGSVADRQSALGMIARKFHPDYLPALRTALSSPDAIVRVQAAAVAARIRPELEKRVADLTALIEQGTAPSADVARAATCLERCAASGLMSETDVARIDAIARAVHVRVAETVDEARQIGNRHTLSPEERSIYEAYLIDSQRFADLRSLRLNRRDRFMRRYRWRPLRVVAAACARRSTQPVRARR